MLHNEQKNQSPSNIITREITYTSPTKTVSQIVSLKKLISKDAWLYIFDIDNTLVAENVTNRLSSYLCKYSDDYEKHRQLVEDHYGELWGEAEKERLHEKLPEDRKPEEKGISECLSGIQKNGDIVSFFSSTDFVDIYEQILKEKVGLKNCDYLKFDVSSWNDDNSPKEFSIKYNQDPKHPGENLIVMVAGFPREVGKKKITNKRAHIEILEKLLAQLGFNLEKSPKNQTVCDDNDDECANAEADGKNVIRVELYSKAKKSKGLGAHFKEALEQSDKRYQKRLNSSSSAALSEQKAADESKNEKSKQTAFSGDDGCSQQVSKSLTANGYHASNFSDYVDSDIKMTDSVLNNNDNSTTIAEPTAREQQKQTPAYIKSLQNPHLASSSSATVSNRLAAEKNEKQKANKNPAANENNASGLKSDSDAQMSDVTQEQKRQTSTTSKSKEPLRNSDQNTASSGMAVEEEKHGDKENKKRKVISDDSVSSQPANINPTAFGSDQDIEMSKPKDEKEEARNQIDSNSNTTVEPQVKRARTT